MKVPAFQPSAYGPFLPHHLKEPTYRLAEDGIYYGIPAKADGVATLLLTGDLMCQGRQQEVAAADGRFSFLENFTYVADLFASADFVVGNLECTLSEDASLMMEEPKVEESIHCNAPSTYLDALRFAGFDLLVTANNHCMDTGLRGLFQTICHLDQYGFLHTGTFMGQSDPRFVMAEIDGIRVAFLSYTTKFNSKHKNLTQEGQDIFLNAYSAQKVMDDVAAAKAAGAEYIIAYNHWGNEYQNMYNDTQPVFAQEMADAGVDYIVGSHPHALQPYDILTAADGREVPVMYSMGNFVSHMTKIVAKETVILQLQLTRDSDGNVILLEDGAIPCRTFKDYLGNSYTTVPITMPYCGDRRSDSFAEAYGHITDVVGSKIEMLGTLPPAA